MIEVWNKVDRLDRTERMRLRNVAERQPENARPVLLSALSGEGVEQLTGAVERRLRKSRVVLDLLLDPADGAGVSWLHRHTEVIAKGLRDDGQLAMTVRADPANAERARARFGSRKDNLQ